MGVTWENMRRRVWALTRSTSRRDSATAPATTANPNCGVAADSSDVDPLPQALRAWEGEGGRVSHDRAQFEKVRSWRRRVLLKKGVVLHEAMGNGAGKCSLAMLDATGVVVAWYDPARIAERAAGKVVDRHMYQFYVPEDIANSVPDRDLRLAAANGNSTQQGWRRRADGAVFWGTTVIDAVVLRDGRIQGFSHVTRRSPGPWENVAQACACVLALLILLATGSPVSAQDSSSMPPNAKASRYGTGWDCASGFKRVDDACVALEVPANAYLDASGNSWKCDRGYLTAGATCAAVKIPENAYMYDAYAPGWRCKRGYREENGACMQISIPAHAHSTESSYGQGWECDRGFATLGATCVAVQVPANGFLTRSGDSWQCERGFKRLDAACTAVAIPKNGYLDSQGDGWTCARGFREGDSTCTALVVPSNAHVDYSGNDWACNREFRRQGTGCVAD
jgi:hypothetical protein